MMCSQLDNITRKTLIFKMTKSRNPELCRAVILETAYGQNTAG